MFVKFSSISLEASSAVEESSTSLLSINLYLSNERSRVISHLVTRGDILLWYKLTQDDEPDDKRKSEGCMANIVLEDAKVPLELALF